MGPLTALEHKIVGTNLTAMRRIRGLQRCLTGSAASAVEPTADLVVHQPRRSASSRALKRRRKWMQATDCTLQSLLACIDPVLPEDYPLACEITQDVIIYDRAELVATSSDGALLGGSALVMALEDELATAFSDGPGVVVFKNAIPHNAIDQVSRAFAGILGQERAAGVAAGDHFGKPGANSRLWNSLEKLAVENPEAFVRYHANDVVPLASRAWLGPAYQVTSQLNVVHPGGAAQTPHRDYHLGFMTNPQKERYPTHAHSASATLTLQGAVAHCDMPLESGPTTFLPHSHKLQSGYLAYELPEFIDYYHAHMVQLPLRKGACACSRSCFRTDDGHRAPGDCVFFNPAVFHAAGANLSGSGIDREANLLQISSAMGRAMETVDRERVTLALYPVLQTLSLSREITTAMVENVIAASAEGYPFPTNLDWDQPIGGLAPQSQADAVAHALQQGWPVAKLADELANRTCNRRSH